MYTVCWPSRWTDRRAEECVFVCNLSPNNLQHAFHTSEHPPAIQLVFDLCDDLCSILKPNTVPFWTLKNMQAPDHFDTGADVHTDLTAVLQCDLWVLRVYPAVFEEYAHRVVNTRPFSSLQYYGNSPFLRQCALGNSSGSPLCILHLQCTEPIDWALRRGHEARKSSQSSTAQAAYLGRKGQQR